MLGVELSDASRTPPPGPTKALDPKDLPPPVLVEDESGFARMLERLSNATEIAVDTEADSFFQYQEQLCLVQISGAGEDWLVDPLAGLPMEGLGALLGDPRCTKIFHDGEYDVLLFRRAFGFSIRNIFDTRVASAALGSTTPGLAAVLREEFGVALDKSQQMSNWGQRPLSRQQIQYARLDTHYLERLKARLATRLSERGREVIVASECRRLETLDVPAREFNADEFLRLKGARTLDRLQLQVLRELFVTRDGIARERNQPPFKVLAHPMLVEIARHMPASHALLARVPGMSPKVAGRIGGALVDAVRRGRERGPLEQIPELPAKDGTHVLDEAGVELHERLKGARKKVAEAEGLEASLVLNRHVLLELAQRRPKTDADLGLLEPWQRELVGRELLDTVAAFERDVAKGDVAPRSKRRKR